MHYKKELYKMFKERIIYSKFINYVIKCCNQYNQSFKNLGVMSIIVIILREVVRQHFFIKPLIQS